MTATTLEDQALLQFDRLLKQGELLWSENSPRRIEGEPFDFEFRVSASLQSKPQDREQSKSTSSHAFPDSDGDWTLGNINHTHKLILNKFCVMRPQFVLPTLDFQPQKDPLNAHDFQAGWDVLTQLPPHTYMMIFNCGIDAGSSVGHKHLQIIPQPQPHPKKFLQLLKKDEVAGYYTVPSAPFRHAAYPLHDLDQTTTTISGSHLENICSQFAKTLDVKPDQAHNVILTHEYLLLIPRTKAWIQVGEEASSKISANAAAMMGLVYSWSEEQFRAYLEFGPMKALGEMGVKV